MPDEVEVLDPESVVESVEKPAQKAPKTHTQAEVDDYVKSRVARKNAEIAKLKEEHSNILKDKDEQLSWYENIFNKQLEDMKKDAPESVKKLLDKLTVQEQYEYLSDIDNAVVLKKSVPALPKPSGEVKPEERFKDLRYKT